MDIKFTACTPADFKIRILYENFHKMNMIDFNTEYQRSEVWKLPKKQLLIDSILRNYDISKVFLRQLVDGRFECLDGQQRLKAIFSYLEDEFSLSSDETPEVGAKKFSQLGNELQWRIWSYPVYATLVHNVDDPTTCRIFLRLQEGMPLNSAEKLNATLGDVRNVVFELSQHKFFTLSGLPEYRFFRRFVAAQILLLESKGAPTNVKFPNLRSMYLSPVKDLKVGSVKKTLNYLAGEFGPSASSIVLSADFVTLFMLTSRLLSDYSLTDHGRCIKEFYSEFLLRVG